METVELEIEADKELVAHTRNLALRYFGGDTETSLAGVLDLAFRMRRLFSHAVISGREETDEPVTRWEFPQSTSSQNISEGIQSWIFRR